MQVQSRSNFTFGQRLDKVEFRNVPFLESGSGPAEREAIMIVDGEQVKHGDKLFILDNDKLEINEAEFDGAFKANFSMPDDSVKLLKKINVNVGGVPCEHFVDISTLHVFTQKGLEVLQGQIGKFLKAI